MYNRNDYFDYSKSSYHGRKLAGTRIFGVYVLHNRPFGWARSWLDRAVQYLHCQALRKQRPPNKGNKL